VGFAVGFASNLLRWNVNMVKENKHHWTGSSAYAGVDLSIIQVYTLFALFLLIREFFHGFFFRIMIKINSLGLKSFVHQFSWLLRSFDGFHINLIS